MKRAYIDITTDLLTALLRIKKDVEIVRVEERYETGDGVVRLHLRGDGLPEYANCAECEPHHRIDSLDEIELEPEFNLCENRVELASYANKPYVEIHAELTTPISIYPSVLSKRQPVTLRLWVGDLQKALSEYRAMVRLDCISKSMNNGTDPSNKNDSAWSI